MAIRYVQKFDNDADDSSKTFTVPDGEVWIVGHVHAACTASADAGNRRLRIRVRDESNVVVGQYEAGATFAATEVQTAEFFPGAPDNTTEVNDTLKVAMPMLVLLPDWELIVEDGTAVDADGDDLVVSFVASVRTP